MKRIINNLSNKKIKDIFDACTRSLKKRVYIDAASKYKDVLINSTEEYDAFVPFNIDKFALIDIDNLDKKKIIYLYNEKFSKSGSSGRIFYDRLMANANGLCPICGCGTPTQLDHFIPKSMYPQLCLTPSNLIPLCRDCNQEKKAISMNYFRIPFHPYFESINELWLDCKIIFSGKNIDKFIVYCSIDNDNYLYTKYLAHYKAYSLGKTYKSKFIATMNSIELDHYNLLKANRNLLYEHIKNNLNSSESDDINSCFSVLYRALINQFDEYCNYLIMRRGI